MDLCELLQPLCFHDDSIHILVTFMIGLVVALHKHRMFCRGPNWCTEAVRKKFSQYSHSQFEDAQEIHFQKNTFLNKSNKNEILIQYMLQLLGLTDKDKKTKTTVPYIDFF